MPDGRAGPCLPGHTQCPPWSGAPTGLLCCLSRAAPSVKGGSPSRHFAPRLTVQDYYDTLSRCRAILTAFCTGAAVTFLPLPSWRGPPTHPQPIHSHTRAHTQPFLLCPRLCIVIQRRAFLLISSGWPCLSSPTASRSCPPLRCRPVPYQQDQQHPGGSLASGHTPAHRRQVGWPAVASAQKLRPTGSPAALLAILPANICTSVPGTLCTCTMKAWCLHVSRPCRVLAAYEYMPRAAAFVYMPKDGPAQPNVAALAAAEGRRLSQWMEQQAVARERLLQLRMGARRRLAEVQGSGDRQRRGAQEEVGGLADRTGKKPRQQQSELEQGAAGPLPGSYSAAMLHAFDDDAARAAHTAAWRAKRAVMRRNADAARQVLIEAAALAASVRASH